MDKIEVLAVDEAHSLPEPFPMPRPGETLPEFLERLTTVQTQIFRDAMPADLQSMMQAPKTLNDMAALLRSDYFARSLRATPDTPRLIAAQRPFHERYRYKPHNGAKEMARRRKQLQRNLLKANGLA